MFHVCHRADTPPKRRKPSVASAIFTTETKIYGKQCRKDARIITTFAP